MSLGVGLLGKATQFLPNADHSECVQVAITAKSLKDIGSLELLNFSNDTSQPSFTCGGAVLDQKLFIC